MKSIFKTTGLLSIVVWLFFLIAGVVLARPLICIISGLFLLLALFRRHRVTKRENSAKEMWQAFTADKEELKDYPYKLWKFSDEGEYRKNIIARILDGDVQGESYSIDFFDANSQPLPQVGQYNVVCDMNRQAYAIVKTVEVSAARYGDVTTELARLEGCSTISQWRRFNENKYRSLCDRMDIVFSKELPLIFERFEVVYPLVQKEGK